MPRTMTEAAALLRSGELTSLALTEACFTLADELDPQLGTYITRYDESALLAAKAADEELASGVDRGVLHGMPLGIKDIIACKEGETTGNSVVFDAEWYAGADAPVVARLREAGAVITGKLTTMEYACGLPDETKPYPMPRNPWDTATWPGGSSSGSGSGVAAGLFLGALGTDTGGSVRLPAAFCGITGMKQTYGLVPKSGCLPLGVTLDHIGPMTRSVADAAAMLAVMAGYDGGDPSMAPGVAAGDYPSMLTGDLTGLAIGVEREHHLGRPGCDPALVDVFESAVAALAEAGATVVDVSIPYYDELASATMLCWPVEAFAFHRRWLAERWTDYGRWTRSVIAAGALLTAADYAQILKVRRIGKAALDRLFTGVDLIVSPTCTAGAISYDELGWDNLMHTIFTPYWDAVGNPALTVPMGFTAAGLPLGLQIAGRPFEDGLVLRAGDAFQRLTTHHLQVPALAAGAIA
ncbi:MAG: amidase [Acidimicrobiales bacterium]|nr:amidase [Acidimicrobiales bacterium]